MKRDPADLLPLSALTPFGRDAARAEAARLERTIAIARRKPLFRDSRRLPHGKGLVGSKLVP